MLGIEEAHIDAILKVTHELQGIRYVVGKKKALSAAIDKMSPAEKWLFTFLCWHCLFNSKFKSLNIERLCLDEPAKDNKATFDLFIKFLRSHNNAFISTSKQRPLLSFLRECDLEHRSFYLSLMTKEWVNCFPVMEIQTLLDLHSISSDEIYVEVAYLKTKLADLDYPVVVRKVASGKKLTPFVVGREPFSSMLWVDKGEGYKRVEKTKKIILDLELSVTPRFVVAGYFDNEKYYPTDFFDDWADFTKYMNNEKNKYGIYDRLCNLHHHILKNIMVNIDGSYPLVCRNEGELLRGLKSLVGQNTDLLICEESSTRTRKPFRVTCRVASGIIDEINQPNSVKVWFNGEVIDIPYSFPGKEQALLTKPQVLKGKVFDFYYLNIGETEYRIGKSINFKVEKWRNKPSRQSGIWIEKCAMCGSTKHKHVTRGFCISCEHNMAYYYDTYGVDNWIEPSKQMQEKRFAKVWSSDLLNSVEYKYKGCVIEGREDGWWKFKSQGIEGGDGSSC